MKVNYWLILGVMLLQNSLLFGQRGIEENQRQVSTAKSADYTLKFAPSQLVSGQFNFSFENKIGAKSALELSVGPTLGTSGFAIFDALGDGLLNNLGNMEGKLGFNASLGYRYYVINRNEATLHGFYLSPVLKFNQLNLVRTGEPFANSSDRQDIKSNLTTFTIQFGYQFVFNGGFVLDMYIGSGLGNRQKNTEGFYSSEPGVTHSYNNTVSKLYAPFTTGVRVGFGGNYKSNK